MEGEGVLVKYHWKTKQSIKSLTQEQASQIQAANFDDETNAYSAEDDRYLRRQRDHARAEYAA